MTQPKKKTGKRFKPGESGNVNGRPKLPPEIKQLKMFTARQLEELISALFHASDAELERIDKDREQPYIWRIMTQVLKKARETGNMGQVDMVLNRLIGKVKERVDVHTFKPSILVRQDGTQVEFTNKAIKEDE